MTFKPVGSRLLCRQPGKCLVGALALGSGCFGAWRKNLGGAEALRSQRLPPLGAIESGYYIHSSSFVLGGPSLVFCSLRGFLLFLVNRISIRRCDWLSI